VRDYATVLTRMHTGRTMKALRGDHLAQLLVFYLITNPHSNMIGVYHLPIMYIAEDLGSPLEGARKALSRVIAEEFCEYDTELGWVFVPRMAEIQVASRLSAGDKRCAAVAREIDRIASPPMKAAFARRYAEPFAPAFTLLKSTTKERGWEAPSEPLRSQEQEHDQDQLQEQDQEQLQARGRLTAGGADAPGDQRDGSAGGDVQTRRKPAVARIEMAEKAMVLPAWLQPHADAWAAFEQIRWKKNAKAPYTLAAQRGIVRKLEQLHADGEDLAAILNASVNAGWTDVYAPRGTRRPASPGGSFAGKNYSGGELERDFAE
jgi:hypothetical protein